MPFLISTGGAFHDIDTLEGDIGSQWTNCGAPPGTETQDNSIYRHNDDMTQPALPPLPHLPPSKVDTMAFEEAGPGPILLKGLTRTSYLV